MSLWDRLKQLLFGAPAGGAVSRPPSGPSVAASSLLERRLSDAVSAKIQKREVFTDREIARESLDIPSPHNIEVACQSLERLFRDDVLYGHRYRRVLRHAYGGEWVYHPLEIPESLALTSKPPVPLRAAAPAPTPVRPQPAPVWSGPVRQTWTPAPAAQPAPNPFEAPEILGLSADEMRKRALRINPYKTAWIGRVDTIPPQSDERTALIDRGLILRGLLSQEQIKEIHRVGDLWLRHHEAVKLAETAAMRSADAVLEEEKKKKAAIKAQKKQESAERKAREAADVARRRATDIFFLGPGVSGGLADHRAHVEKLQKAGLPVLASPADVATGLGIAIPRLRWLAFHSDAAERTHYVHFEVKKRSGGMRRLSAPHKELAATQQWILHNILERLPVEEQAHGFVKARSTVTNATPHLGRDVVVNLDVSDFFPSITFRRVKGVFQKIGYSPAAATVLALLCTESPRAAVEYDGKRYLVADGERALPQGACTSPALSNQVSRKLDRRLRGMCARHGWSYTRYADDLTLSAPEGKRGEVPMLIARVRHILEQEGFQVNPRKGRVQRAAGRQSVTGIVVNRKLSLARDEVRRLRAILHRARRDGLKAQNRENRPNFESWLRGKLAYLAMVDRPRGLAMLRELDAIQGRAAS
jgi:retron-type reverse transcriptase